MTSSLADRLKERLKEKNMTVSELEKRAGLKPFSARNITRGLSRKPSAANLQAIAGALECTVPDLLGEERPSPLFTPRKTVEIVEDLALFEETVACVMKQIHEMDKKPRLQQLFLIFQEAYGYAIKLNPAHVDQNFIRWLLQEILP